MDAFKVLTGGGARFDRKKFASDIAAFEPVPSKASTSKALPKELDFFGTSIATHDTPNSDVNILSKGKKRNRAERAKEQDEAAAIDFAAFLRKYRIKYTGLEPPNPITSWSDLTSRHTIAPCLGKNWAAMGLQEPTAIQMASWAVILEERDLLACAPTGSGKTLSFVLPLLALNPPAAMATSKLCRPNSVIVEPTRELVMQVWREVTKLGKDGGWVISTLRETKADKGKTSKKKAKAQQRSEALIASDVGALVSMESPKKIERDHSEPESVMKDADVLITTPLRLIYAVRAGDVDLSNVQNLVLDEADKLFELNFTEQTDEIIAACTHSKLRKAMFSATLPSGVEELAKSVMGGGGVSMVRAIIGHKDAATESIKQELHFVGTEDHKLLSLRSLIQEGQFTPPVLIFVQSILRAKELATELVFDGVNVDCIHAERTAEERDGVVRSFAEGKTWCLISTDVMGRGVDFKGVRLVINYDFPQSGGSYIHRIGRTGRAGREGRAVTFFTKADAPHLKSVVNVMRASGCDVPQWMLDLKNPSQDQKKSMRMKPLSRKDVSSTHGSGAGSKFDRRGKVRKREMGSQSTQKITPLITANKKKGNSRKGISLEE